MEWFVTWLIRIAVNWITWINYYVFSRLCVVMTRYINNVFSVYSNYWVDNWNFSFNIAIIELILSRAYDRVLTVMAMTVSVTVAVAVTVTETMAVVMVVTFQRNHLRSNLLTL
ncbi:hypothetical protein [Viridibacillus arvi]|uniref:hypothetical protein n=1 Tax=Viridibacillus arvi TaxID=263475 RepID=UPI001B80B594|nr:hypothetical protein [Viridibacillus arvi]